MTEFQLLKWVATAAIFGSIANIGLAPWIRFVNGWLNRRGYYLRKDKVEPRKKCVVCKELDAILGDRCPHCKEFGL